MSTTDHQLSDALADFNIQSLYEKLSKQEVTIDILWDLDKELLDDIGLTPVEKLKYKKAKENWEIQKKEKGASSFLETKTPNHDKGNGNPLTKGEKEMSITGMYSLS